MKYTPRKYQLEGRDFLRQRNFAMLGDACGVGKTGQAIIAMQDHWDVLIVCPASVKSQWKQALKDWIGRDSTVVSTSDLPAILTKTIIINYDLIIREKTLEGLLPMRFDLIVFDECHRLKSLTAKRTKVALGQKFLRSRTNRMWFLTGTPVKNRTIDLFPILRSCAPEVLGPYNSYLKFAYRYCGAYQGRFGLDVSGASKTEELCERLKGFMLRREKRDVLTELPPRIVSLIKMECTPQVLKLIQEEEEKTIEQAGENDPAKFQLGEQVRIRQALAKHKVVAAIDYIKDRLEEHDKIVVFYHHKEVLSELRRHLHAVPSVFIDGSVPADRRAAVVEDFRTRKECRLFFGQMGACGEGVDGLQQSSSYCIFVEPSWSHTDLEQCIGRLERSGQRSDVNVDILVIKETLEERMLEVVAEKLKVDKKLYNLKEENNFMAKKETVVKEEMPCGQVNTEQVNARLVDLLEKLLALLTVVLTPKQIMKEQAAPQTARPPEPEVTEKEPQEVDVPQEDDVTHDSIRARAQDICDLRKGGVGSAAVAAIVKEVGGGKIADLDTAAKRLKTMKKLDSLYTKYAQEDAKKDE